MIKKQDTYVVIMAGGIGSRFWPQSREDYPKQFLDVLGLGKTLIQMTYDRFAKIVPNANIFIITSKKYVPILKQQLPKLKSNQIVAEPSRKNTAACIAYISHKLATINPNATFIVAPADHLITQPRTFNTAIGKAVNFAAQNNALVTLGITPTRPDTGYGYIQLVEDNNNKTGIFKVKAFAEKPSLEIANMFLASGDYFWNSGIFIWHVKTILSAFSQWAPDINKYFIDENNQFYNTPNEANFIEQAYESCKSTSIDYAIMEHADNSYVIPAKFEWSDLGTWTSVWEKHHKDAHNNAIEANTMLYNTQNCIINAPKNKLIVLQDLDGYCVIDTNDVLMVCKLNKEQQIKQFNIDAKAINPSYV